ncbi:MAG: amino acid adenylation domain-containing protein [Nostoc sp. DedQUE08]|uniref:non-ribosomal peptide synthetase n=1 Tax=Nostoc sp. DedQUE08 TaxID=3075393 RepID=UPI002AD2972F|nr:non-ribosomal peptide synthetase [Nostoc sp. DedQUE08]MDZ8064929.1 amino acid adenylation domain-containing protein [Nostoc sp. DedQUE08]
MNLTELLENLSANNVELWIDGGKLRYRSPKKSLTSELLGEIEQYKPEIIRILSQSINQAATYPLSHGQQALWSLYQLAPSNTAYNGTYAAKLVTNLDIPALKQAAQALFERHPGLRTTFVTIDGESVQTVHENQQVDFSIQETFDLGQDDVNKWLSERSDRSFDLEQGSILRFDLLINHTKTDKLPTKEHILLITLHQIVGDFWSLEIMLSELRALYKAIITGVAAQLPVQNYQYQDYVNWSEQMLGSSEGERLWAYWQQQLSGELPLLNLPTDRPRPQTQTYNGASKFFTVEEKLRQLLTKLAKREDTSLYIILLTALQILLLRYTNQEDILIGSLMGNWSRSEFEKIVDHFTNPVVLRGDLSGKPTFQELLGRSRSCVLDALEHQDYPFPLLVERLQPVRNPSFSPLYQVAFAWDSYHQNDTEVSLMDSDGLIVESMIPETKGAAFDLTLTILEAPGSLKGTWNYNTDLFDDSTIERMMGHFVTMLEAIVANPQQRISQLPMLREFERQQSLVEWNDTQADYPIDKCIHQLFEEQVERTPNAVAVVFENQQLTYHELNCQANSLAHYLRSLGVGTDVLVGICVERSLEMVVGLLSILKAGGAYVPLDSEYPKDRLSFMLEDAQVSVLLSQKRLLDKLPEYQAKLVCLDEVCSEILQNKQDNLIKVVTATHLANVIYTSGSTGKPKGVMVEHSGLCNLAQAQIQTFGLSGDSRVLQFASFSFDACISEILMAFGSGATLYLGTKDSLMPGMPLIDRLKNDGITHVTLPPSALAVLPQEELPTLQTIIVAGEACPIELMRQWATGRNFFNAYGPTEASVCAAIAKCTTQDQKISIGRPISNTQIYILDQNLQPVPVGVPGELHIGGAGLARGYLNRPELTQEKFIPNPFGGGRGQGSRGAGEQGGRGAIQHSARAKRPATANSTQHSALLYKTGDLARYLPDGNIEYLGRIDNQVKIRGFRIELGEIEAALSQHPHVQASCVIAREDIRGDKRLVAYIVPQPQVTPRISVLRSFLKEKLPEYMVPSAFVILESLPLTPNGKIDRRALPAPKPSSELLEKYVAPRTPIEEILASIWQQVLRVELVGRHNDFFELGGHSLLATQFISRVRSRLKVEIPLRSLFAAPTIAELAPSIQQLQQQDIELSAPPILRRVENAEIPLSYAQQRLWFLDQLESNSALYSIVIGLRLVGTLNLAALEQSLKEIIDRHEALRTNFVTVDGKPTQIIQTQTNWTVTVIDLQHLPTLVLSEAVGAASASAEVTEQKTVAQKLLEQRAIEPFDLAHDPLMRATLVMLSPTEQWLLVCMHHVVSDGWSIGVFVQELQALYNTYSQGQPSLRDATRTPLLPLPIQYADFSIWQRQWLQGEVLQNHLSYWQQQLANAPTFLPLPTDRPRPPVQTFNGSYHVFTLSVELTQKLLQLSQQQGVTSFMTLLAAYNTLLYRYTGQEDILVGTPIANRDRTELEGLIGFFVNTLVMRTDLAGNPSFNELLPRLREMALSAYAHQDLPFEMLVEALQPERDLSHTPLFQVMFVLLNAPMSEIELTGLSVSGLPIGITTAKFDLTLTIENTPNGLFGWWEYNTDLFDSSTIERITGHFLTLLEAIVANPSERISQLPILTASEQQQLLVEWNDTQVDYPQDKCIHQLFEEQVERTPDAIAVVFENQQLTYQELNTRANQLAHYLQSLGVRADALVGICVERSLEMVVGLLGILKAGGTYVPLDPEYPQERLRFILEDAQVSVLLSQHHLVEKLPECQAQLVNLDTDWQLISQLAQENALVQLTVGIANAQASNLAYVIYTSGSTGQPKGVQISHKSVSNFLSAMQQRPGITKQDTLLAITTIAFDIAALEIFLPITVGACLVIASRDVTLDGRELFDLLVKSQATIMQATPATWRLLLDSNYQFSDLKILCGGEALPWDLVNQLLAKSASLWNLYGPTEATIWSSVSQLESNESLISIGRPIDNTQIYILDQNLQPVPVGVPGELHIGGAGLARGYFNRPELTQEKFIPNPFSGGRGQGAGSRERERLYKTGDLARYLPDGKIEYLGRIDNQVKIRGFRIELGEIEAVLGQHPNVQASCVIAREDIRDDKRLVAYIVPEPQVTLTISELRSVLKEKLPDYMLPSAIVILESLPLTPNGKIDRRALPAPKPSSELSDKYVAPRTPVEEILALIWQQVLKVELVGRHDNFFELGGHSLLATQLISRVRNSLKIELPLRSLFAAPTIAQLAPSIQQLQQQNLELAAPPILPRTGNTELVLSFAQQRLWFLDQFEPNSASYNIPVGLRLVGTTNVVALQQSLIEIIHRHEALRTNFVTVDGQAAQIIQTKTNWTVTVVDLQHLSTIEQEIAALKLVQQQAIEPFDLAEDVLIRATLVVLSETEQWLLVCMHHVVSDGWSIGVFVQELQALYNAYSQGELSPLIPLTIQYADFAIWQRQWLQGSVLNSQLSYWQEQLANVPTFLPLPTDRPRPAVQTFNGANLEFALSAELTQQLTKLSQEQGVTLFMTLLAAYNTLLYRYTGQTDILVGTPIANRDRTELEGLIGFFVNTLVMRTDLSENPSFNELLPRIREMALSAYAHQDLPFEMLVEALQPERDLSHTPLFQVMFVLQNAPIEVELTGLTVSSLPIEGAIAKFDLTLAIENTTTGLVGGWEYNTDLFDASTIERMTGHFVTLLEGIVANPKQRISQLPILTASEQQQLLVEWNNTQVDYPIDKCVHQLFEEQVERTPDAVAVVFENQQLTYHELNCRANQLAHYLQSLGVGADVLVGICVERSLEMVVGLLGILKAGGAYVPLDPEYPQDRLSFTLADAQVSVLLTQQHLVESLPQHQARVVHLDQDWIAIAKFSQENPSADVQASNVAYVIYTSGSTGQPKGVMLSHSNLCNHMFWMQATFPLTKKDKVLQKTPFGFDASVWEFYAPLLAGGQLLIAEPGGHTDSAYLIKLIVQQQVTTIQLVPSLLQMLLEQGGIETCHSLKHVFCGGEVLPVTLQEGLLSKLDVNLHNLYGPTEACIDVTFWNCQREIHPQLVPIGRPIDNTQIYILDQNLQPVPVGIPGELHIGGAGLARGYLNRPELTQEKFISNPFEKAAVRLRSPIGGSKLYKTGDLGRYLPDGNIEYLGRIDNQVKIRGFRIELGEIEAALSQYEDVQVCCVIVSEDIPGNKRLVAYIVPQSQITPTVSELRSFLKEKLPEYMIPSAFVILESLPLTPNGKIDRRALPEPEARTGIEIDIVQPRTPIEEKLTQIWAQVLRVEKIGIHDNFFELGGDSILSIQIITRAKLAGIELTVKQLFANQTIAQLATVAGTTKTLQIEQELVTGTLPLTPIQHWFFEQKLSEKHHFNQSFLLTVPSNLNLEILEKVWQQLLKHHDALRLRFTQTDTIWQQTHADPTDNITISRFDLSTVPETEIETVIETKASELQASLNLSENIVQIAFFWLGIDKKARLLIVIHHLVVDGVSWRILLEDLQTAYQQLSQGKAIQLPAKTTSFKDWAQQLTEYAQSEVLKTELDYWLSASYDAVDSIPVDYSQGINTTASAKTISVSLNEAETQALLQDVPKAYKTQINDILLTALTLVLSRWTNSESVLFNLEGHGREEIVDGLDLSRTVGWFTTIFPVIVELGIIDDLGTALKSVKEQLRVIPNKGIGYGLLRYLNVDAEISAQLERIPQAEISFNYLGQFAQVVNTFSLMQIANEPSGNSQSLQGQRHYLLDINAIITNEQLQIDWTYSSNIHQHETIENIAQEFVEILQELIAHCLSPENAGYTPTDFPLINLNQLELDQILQNL